MIGLDNNSLNQRLNGLDMAGQSAAAFVFLRIITFNLKIIFVMFSFIFAHLSPVEEVQE